MAGRVVLYVVASWLMAAHFLRAGDLVVMALCLVAPALFFVRQRWSLLVLQGLSYGATAVWLVTAWQIVAMRRMFGMPWHLSAIILAGVAAFTLLAGLLLRSRSLRDRYRAEG